MFILKRNFFKYWITNFRYSQSIYIPWNIPCEPFYVRGQFSSCDVAEVDHQWPPSDTSHVALITYTGAIDK